MQTWGPSVLDRARSRCKGPGAEISQSIEEWTEAVRVRWREAWVARRGHGAPWGQVLSTKFSCAYQERAVSTCCAEAEPVTFPFSSCALSLRCLTSLVISVALWSADAWDFPGKNTEVGFHLLQGIFTTQGSNLGLCTAGRFSTA